jgi:hypothetical protein
MFDINALSQQSIQAKMDTSINPYPEMEVVLQIETDEKAVTFRGGLSKAQEGKPSRPWAALDIKCRLISSATVDLAEVAKERGRPVNEMGLTHGIMLDLTEQGALDTGPGRNTALGALREAVDQNSADQPWHYEMLKGQTFKAKIAIKADKEDPTKLYNRIAGVAHV